MAKENERTLWMKENFMDLHHEGASIKEIADKYDLSVSTVYRSLQEIAEANKVSRESLLKVVRTPTTKFYREEQERIRVRKEEFDEGFAELENILISLIQRIDETLKEEKAQ